MIELQIADCRLQIADCRLQGSALIEAEITWQRDVVEACRLETVHFKGLIDRFRRPKL